MPLRDKAAEAEAATGEVPAVAEEALAAAATPSDRLVARSSRAELWEQPSVVKVEAYDYEKEVVAGRASEFDLLNTFTCCVFKSLLSFSLCCLHGIKGGGFSCNGRKSPGRSSEETEGTRYTCLIG